MSRKKKAAPKKSGLEKFKALPKATQRRHFIKWGVGLGVLGVAAGAISGYDAQNKELHDLSVIGKGKPVVVQIHDTSCSICRRLKSRTLSALDGQDRIEYRIADIVSTKGRAFQQKYGVQKTTLMLFDAKGKHIDTVVGLQTQDQLQRLFTRSFPIAS